MPSHKYKHGTPKRPYISSGYRKGHTLKDTTV